MITYASAFTQKPTRIGSGGDKVFQLHSPEGKTITFYVSLMDPSFVTVIGIAKADTLPIFFAKATFAQLLNEGWKLR